jgi:hypothetical protein
VKVCRRSVEALIDLRGGSGKQLALGATQR